MEYLRKHTHTQCMDVCTYMYMYIYIYVYIYIYMVPPGGCIYIYVHTHICIYIYRQTPVNTLKRCLFVSYLGPSRPCLVLWCCPWLPVRNWFERWRGGAFQAMKGPSKDGFDDIGLIRGFRIWFCNHFPAVGMTPSSWLPKFYCTGTALKCQVLNNEEAPCSPRAL